MGHMDPCPTLAGGVDAASEPLLACPPPLAHCLEVSGHTWGFPNSSDQTCAGLGGSVLCLREGGPEDPRLWRTGLLS